MFSQTMEVFNCGKEQIFHEYRNRILSHHSMNNVTQILIEPQIILIKRSSQIINNLVDIEYYIHKRDIKI